MSKSIITLISTAMSQKKRLRLFYNGGFREVEPFCLGKAKTGKVLLRAYQVSGYSVSGEPTDWKLLDISKISSCTLTGADFSLRYDYNPDDPAMAEVYLAI